MGAACRILLLAYCLLLAIVAGCGSKPAATISASYIEKDGAGAIVTGSTGNMTSNKAGALVTVGGSADESITVTIAKIGDDKVAIDISHPSFDAKQLDIRLGESKEVFFENGSFGARIDFSEAK